LLVYNNQIYAGTFGGGIYKSVNNGDEWTEVNQGLTNMIVYCFASNSAGEIFAGTDGGGVYRTTDNGNYWFQDTSGLNDTRIWSLTVRQNGYIFAGSYGNGVYKSTKSTPVEELKINSDVYLEQNYPNPFSQKTNVYYKLPLSSKTAKLEISDVLGNVRRSIYLENADDMVEVDLSGLENGIYFYTLITNDQKLQTRMMTLVR
jgi:hypothetical protein